MNSSHSDSQLTSTGGTSRDASIARVRKRERGSNLIELAFMMPLMLMLVFGIFEFGRLFYIQLSLQSAVREASRFSIVGATNEGQTRAQSIVEHVREHAPGLEIEEEHVTIMGPGGAGDPGGPGDVVTIQVDYDVQLVTPIISDLFPEEGHHFTISLLARNEPFPGAPQAP